MVIALYSLELLHALRNTCIKKRVIKAQLAPVGQHPGISTIEMPQVKRRVRVCPIDFG